MRVAFYVFCLLACSFAALLTDCNDRNHKPTETMMHLHTTMEAPKAAQKPKTLEIHGDTRQDEYYWLNDREDEEVLAYLRAENAYLDTVMAPLKDFRETLYQEIIGRIQQTDMSVPYLKNGYWYYSRYEEGKEYPMHARKAGSLDAEEDLMLDVNKLAEPFPYYQAAGLTVSPNNRLLVYGEDTLSRRIYTLRFLDLETGQMLEDQIPNTSANVAWANDNQTLFYAVKDETLRSYKIFRHRLGTPVSDDVEVYHEADPTFSCYVGRTKSDQYLLIASQQTVSTEYRLLNADTPEDAFQVFLPRQRDHEYSIDHFGEHWYIRTNWEAKNFRLMRTPLQQTEQTQWEEVIAHRDDVLLEGMDLFNRYLVLSERIKGITQLRIRPWEAPGKEHYINFGEEAFVTGTGANYEFDTEDLRIYYTSLTTPNSVYDYQMETRELTLLKRQEVLGGYNPEEYNTERMYAKARDGVQVPITLVYKKSTFQQNGSAPLLLYGYGSYGYSMDPAFSSVRLSLLNRGFAFAIAHIRGGEELGRAWYENGKLLHKKNTFTDFIDCAEHLLAQQYTSKDKLFASGGSAGGLLMGAVINMRPDLWKGVHAAVPFVDVVTTMLDERIPLTTGEFDEWGNPKDPEYYAYIKSYSPYDNIEAKDYPALLVTTGLHDSQVQYWEPAKWVARLRTLKTDKNPLLLYTNMETGHGGASGRFERYKETALEYAFLLDLAQRAQ